MRVDFYHLTQGSAAEALPALAAKVLASGAKLFVADTRDAARNSIADALWAAPGFLANGRADEDDPERQPILIAADLPETPANGAAMAALTDGAWRAAARNYGRVFLMFAEDGRAAARECWTELREDSTVERHYWVQEGGGCREGP